MRKLIVAILVSLGLALPVGTAQAGGYYRHHHHHHDGALVAAGVLGGALALGVVLSQPRYYGPPPAAVYYGPPPPVYYYGPGATYYASPPAVSCYQDQVYRFLPDGSVQWGTRTRCY